MASSTRGSKRKDVGGGTADVLPASMSTTPPGRPTFPKDLFTGKVFVRGDPKNYENYRYQYALSSHIEYGYMEPAAIIYPQPGTADQDVVTAIKYAKDNGLAIAVRTGGHQYSGASSTSGNNIQLDMSEAYLQYEYTKETGLVHVGISHSLLSLNRKLAQDKVFVPHGQCSHVHVGGHAHSGGYGQLERAFGLFADHIVWIRVITADGHMHEIDRNTNVKHEKELFYAILGGGPGNFAVLTHIKLKPHRDEDHPKSIGLKVARAYSKKVLLELLKLTAEMSDDEEFPGDVDYCVTVMSGATTERLNDWGHTQLDDMQLKEHRVNYGDVEIPFWPPLILVYLQWANTGGASQDMDDKVALFFRRVKTALGVDPNASVGGVDHDSKHTSWFRHIVDSTADALKERLTLHLDFGFSNSSWIYTFFDDSSHRPLSILAGDWVFMNVREFNLPYEKRTWSTNSISLAADKWAEYTTQCIHELEADLTNGLKQCVQIMVFGGKNSQFRLKADNKTAYSWRSDLTSVVVLDCFYDMEDIGAQALGRNPRHNALAWQAENDRGLKGPSGCFSKGIDRRLLWGSYGDFASGEFNMGNVYHLYHESKQKYDKLVAIKRRVDPGNIFTPNSFCVGFPPGLPPASADASDRATKIDEDHAQHLREHFEERANEFI